MDETTKAKVFQLVGKVTGRGIENIDLNKDLKSQFELDSIQIVELFATLEKEFNIELPLSMLTVKTGTSFFNILDEQLKKKS
jgi:acyl carrier protein